MADEKISEILQNMKYCSKYGAGQNREQHLADKLALLKELQTMLRKNELQQALLDKGLLCIIALWLRPHNDGHLALYSIRHKLLKLLLHHCKCIKKGHLSKSKLGKIVFKLSSDPKETITNRRLATKLFTTWARDVYKIQTDYRDNSSKDRMQKEMEQVSEQAMVVDATPSHMHATAAIEDPDDAESGNVTMCEETIAVNQPASVDPSLRTSVSKQGSFISVHTEKMADDSINEILQHMEHCTKHEAGQDREQHEASRLALLNELETMLSKNELQQALLDKGLLCIIALWLKPQNECRLPPFSIRQKLLKLLLHHCNCIKKRHLSESNLINIIFQLCSHHDEKITNRILATELFTTWARGLYNIQTDYLGISSKDQMQKEMEQVSEQAMAVDATPSHMHATAAIEDPDDAESGNVTKCEETIAVNQPATVDPSLRTSFSMPGSFVSPSSRISIAEAYNISDDQMRKCDRILDSFFRKKNQTCTSRVNLG